MREVVIVRAETRGDTARGGAVAVAPAVQSEAGHATEAKPMEITRTVRVVMAGGGTGGHLYPGLAVAEALRHRLGEHLELVWAATPRPVDQRLLGQYGRITCASPCSRS